MPRRDKSTKQIPLLHPFELCLRVGSLHARNSEEDLEVVSMTCRTRCSNLMRFQTAHTFCDVEIHEDVSNLVGVPVTSYKIAGTSTHYTRVEDVVDAILAEVLSSEQTFEVSSG